MSTLDIDLKLATLKESKLIWQWRNDPSTRNNSLKTKPITWIDHATWYQKILKDQNSKMYVSFFNNIPIGVVRFDIKNAQMRTYNININIAPQSRGKGFGKTLLNKSIIKLRQEDPFLVRISAEVKKENLLSNKLFLSSGFHLIKEESGINQYYLTVS